MLKVSENISLKPYNTFGIDVSASVMVECDDKTELVDCILKPSCLCNPRLVLGGGSNILFTGNFNGIIYFPTIKGIEMTDKTSENVFLRVGAGEVWDDFVQYCVDHNYYGIENLSLIPGNVGACPVQNIGAFGVEVGDVISEVETVDLNTGKLIEFSNDECLFSYRNSVFKNPAYKNRLIITHVTFRLPLMSDFVLHYGNIKEEIGSVKGINLKSVRNAVINIRNRKLPDTKILGSAGSFFKNPVVEKSLADSIKTKFPKMPYFPAEEQTVKLAAGWLIDQCGWKGKRIGDAGVHVNQALVLVNYGKATGNEIISLAEKIKESVFDLFGVRIEPEVNII
jgi:UDP-N-acetylmuramate dehydrogenase